ncbi:hypothetical protein PG997_008956 [Apiospora hydei]|uniref:Uncharacterized protein n=1 Tax=Apiospora hydei TaxID=1337664 RepID=A0ABR1WGC2_9PEZI
MPGEPSGELRRMFNFGPSLVQFGPAPVDLGWTAENVGRHSGRTDRDWLAGRGTPVPDWRALEPLNPSCAASQILVLSARSEGPSDPPGVLARRPGEVEAKTEV